MDTLHEWHRLVAGDGEFQTLLAEDVVFHSPVVHTPIEGRDATALYLAAAAHVLVNDHFRYVREVVGERDAALEFVTEVDGTTINGVDLLSWGDDGRIVDVKVLIRPKRAFDLIHRLMADLLAAGGA